MTPASNSGSASGKFDANLAAFIRVDEEALIFQGKLALPMLKPQLSSGSAVDQDPQDAENEADQKLDRAIRAAFAEAHAEDKRGTGSGGDGDEGEGEGDGSREEGMKEEAQTTDDACKSCRDNCPPCEGQLRILRRELESTRAECVCLQFDVEDRDRELKAEREGKAMLRARNATLLEESGVLREERNMLLNEKGMLREESTTLRNKKTTLLDAKAPLQAAKVTLQAEKTTLEAEEATLHAEAAILLARIALLEREAKESDQRMEAEFRRGAEAGLKMCGREHADKESNSQAAGGDSIMADVDVPAVNADATKSRKRPAPPAGDDSPDNASRRSKRLRRAQQSQPEVSAQSISTPPTQIGDAAGNPVTESADGSPSRAAWKVTPSGGQGEQAPGESEGQSKKVSGARWHRKQNTSKKSESKESLRILSS